jgi:hypothetical protein
MGSSVKDRGAIVLFSGDPKSTLQAIRAGQQFRSVVLLTCVHRGLERSPSIDRRPAALARFFGDRDLFRHRVVRTDRMFGFLAREHYLARLRSHGPAAAGFCAPCRLAMHWRAAVECRRTGTAHVLDGSTSTSTLGRANLDGLRAFYAEQAISYEGLTDVDETAVADILDAMRFRGGPEEGESDRPLRCSLRTVDRLLTAGRTRALDGLVAAKIEVIRSMTATFVAEGDRSPLSKLIED